MFQSVNRLFDGPLTESLQGAHVECASQQLCAATAPTPASQWPLRLAAMAAVMVGLGMAGCGQKAEQDLIASARTYIDKKDNAAAVVQLKAALQQHPQSAQARYLLGATLLRTGDPAAAIVELERARELKHSDAEVLPMLARAQVAMGRAKKVTDLYAQTTLSDPRAMADLSAVVASAFAAQGQADRSEAAVVKSLQYDPKNSEARLLQARLKSGRGQIDEAVALMDSLIADEPRNREAWYFKGESLSKGKRTDDAAKAFEQALAIDPKFLMAHTALIAVLMQRRDIKEFRARVEQMKSVLPGQPDTRYFEVQVALIDKDFDKARGVVRQLIRELPDNARVLQLAGAVELTAGSSVLAESYLAKALQMQPKLVPARRLLAQAYLRSDQPARALTTLQPLLDNTASAETLVLAGEAYFQSSQWKESEAYFTRAAKFLPDDVRLRTALAMTKIAKGNAEGGMADLENLAAADPSTYTDLALISARIRRNDLVSALKDVSRLEAKLPQSALPHHLRGRVKMRLKDAAGARESFEKALAADPSYLPSIANLAELDVADKRIDTAIKRFQALLAREPSSYRALLALAELKQQSGAKAEEIRKLLSDAIKASPGEVAPRIKLIDYLLATQDVSGARVAAQEALSALPDDPRALDALGRAQLAGGDLQQAISNFTKVTSLQSDSPTAYMWLAQAQLASKDMASARRSLTRALEIDPAALAAQSALIQVAMSQQHPEEALALTRTVQKQRPTEAVGYLLEADVFVSQRRWEPAIAALRKAMDRQKSTTVVIRMHATLLAADKPADAEQLSERWLRDNAKDTVYLSYLGASEMSRGLLSQAESRYRSVLVLEADNVNALNNVAWVMTRQGKKGALPFAEKANKLTPDQPSLMDTLAAALAAEGRLDQAIELQRKTLARSDGRPEFRLHLAKLLIASGDRAAARSELVTLAKLGAKFQDRAEAVKLLQTL